MELGVIDAEEFFKNKFMVLRVDTDTGIGDGEFDIFGGFIFAGNELGFDGDVATVGGIFDGIADDIAKSLDKAFEIDMELG